MVNLKEEIEKKRKSIDKEIKALRMSIRPQEDKIKSLQDEIVNEKYKIWELEKELELLDVHECKLRLKDWVSSEFAKLSDADKENYNMILLQFGNFEDREFNSEKILDVEDAFSIINWEDENYNKLAHPIPNVPMPDISVINDFEMILPKMDDQDGSTNECWYKCFAVTNNYDIVEFIIRDDGLLLDDVKLNVIDTIIL